MAGEFSYFIQFHDENDEQFYLKSFINERKNTILIYLSNLKQSWTGTLNEEQVRNLAKKFPLETNDSFYSHTQRAFSKGKKAHIDGRNYVFNCKKLANNRLELIWKEHIEALNSLKIVGNIELDCRPNDEILSKIMNSNLEELQIFQTENEEKMKEIQQLNQQLTKALATIKRTVDLKEELENDLYRKFVLVLNAKKEELAKLKYQLEEFHNEHDHQSFSMDMTIHSPTSNKRSREEITQSDTSEDDLLSTIESKTKSLNNDQESSLELGNDQMDYKRSTIPKYHQRRKYPAETSTTSTRPIRRHTSRSSTMTSINPALRDDSQTNEDLLNKI